MTETDAIEIISYHISRYGYSTDIEKEVLQTSIEALEKQVPLKPESSYKFSGYGMRYGCCPVCEASLNEEMKYCDECGQKLDWSK